MTGSGESPPLRFTASDDVAATDGGFLRRGVRRTLAFADARMNALYGWRFNPLYHSGGIVVLTLVVMLLTGLYLVIFYRIGSPYESVARIDAQILAGRWIRALHRYAADVAVVAAFVHALRMFAQGRSWGPRALAWLSGLVLLFVIYVCGWTGYVMIWDAQAQALAVEGARFLDVIPIFSEPIARTFVGERPLPAAFFFLNLFLHIALPIGVAVILWIHVARVARPALLPPRPLLWGLVGLLLALSVVLPAPLGPRADLFRLPPKVDLDVFYSFWVPVSRAMSPGAVWIALAAVGGALALVPVATRPRRELLPKPSVVEERLCTGCNQCALDCPYDAISMIVRTDGREGLVARVDPDLCVSCGICTGSCAPMGVGPPLRTGRDQLREIKAYLADHVFVPTDLIVVACERGAGRAADPGELGASTLIPVTCAGNLHTSAIEFLVRSGAGGVLVAACPPRDCWSREGPK